jgi:uncharacterized membrane protein
MKKNADERLYLLDELRGFLILGVVESHTLFDMYHIFGFDMPWVESDFVNSISDIGAMLFILISGMVSKFSRDNISRGLKLMCVAIALTLVTRIVIPDYVVYAGILHLLAFAIVLLELIKPVISKIPKFTGVILNILLAILSWNLYERRISFLGFKLFDIPDDIMNGGLSYLLGLKIKNITISSDYYPLLPWITFFFLGFYLIEYIEKEPVKRFFAKKRCAFLAKTGTLSLWIYLIHQPIIYGILYLVTLI